MKLLFNEFSYSDSLPELFEFFFLCKGDFFIIKVDAENNRPGSVSGRPVITKLLVTFEPLQQVGGIADVDLIV